VRIVDGDAAREAVVAADRAAKKLRVARNVAKDQFVTAYVHITLEVKQLFPRDPRMQDLFFDDVEKDQNEPEAEAPPEAGAAWRARPALKAWRRSRRTLRQARDEARGGLRDRNPPA
jgi:hypothetical protein